VGAVDKTVEQDIAVLLFGGIVVMLLLALALVAFFLLYQKKLIGQQLALQTIQSVYQKDLLVATIQAEDRERERIGNDLHDEIGSSLSAVKMLMVQLAESVSTTEKEKEVVAIIEGILGDTLQNIRNISQSLHPAVLARFGLAKALQNLGLVCADAFANGMDVQVELNAVLTQSQELALYRIVQEVVNNAMKHAQASRVTVQLRHQPGILALTVVDDGRGFDYALAQRSNRIGLGLKSLAARASLLDASLHLESAPGKGTGVRVEMPI
jgi:signal transduction histidine kinase